MELVPVVHDDVPQRRAQIARLYHRKFTPDLIAAQLGLDHTTVYNDIKLIREAYLNLATRDYAAQVADEIASLNQIEANAWDAWDRSIEQKVREKVKMEPEPLGSGEKSAKAPSKITLREINRENMAGDPRFLEIALQCVDKRMKLLGLAQPSRHIHLNIESSVPDQLNDTLKERLDAYANTAFADDEAETVIGADRPDESVDSASAAPKTGLISHLRRT